MLVTVAIDMDLGVQPARIAERSCFDEHDARIAAASEMGRSLRAEIFRTDTGSPVLRERLEAVAWTDSADFGIPTRTGNECPSASGILAMADAKQMRRRGVKGRARPRPPRAGTD